MRYFFSSSLPCLSSCYDPSIFIMSIRRGSWNHGSSEICMLIFKLVYILFHIIYPFLFHQYQCKNGPPVIENFLPWLLGVLVLLGRSSLDFLLYFLLSVWLLRIKSKVVLESVLDHSSPLCSLWNYSSTIQVKRTLSYGLNFWILPSLVLLAPSNWMMLLLCTNCVRVGPHW